MHPAQSCSTRHPRPPLMLAAALVFTSGCSATPSSSDPATSTTDRAETGDSSGAEASDTVSTISTGAETGGTPTSGDTGGSTEGDDCPPDAPFRCGDTCVDTDTDPAHCGRCGAACGSDESCSAGACVLECTGGTVECAGECVALCGECGFGCNDQQECIDGACMGPREWGDPELIGQGFLPRVAVDGIGNATAVWTFQGARTSRYGVAADVWGASEPIGGIDGAQPAVAVGDSGNGVAVWGGVGGLWAARYDAVTGTWGLPQGPSNGGGLPLAMGMASDGSVIVAYSLTFGGDEDFAGWSEAWAQRLVGRGDIWQPAESIWEDGSSVSVTSGSVDLAVDGAGNAIAVWQATDGGDGYVVANRYDASATSWGLPLQLALGLTPRIAMDGDDNAIVASSDGSVSVHRYDTVSDSWTGPEPVPMPPLSGGGAPRLGIDESGTAVVVFNDVGGSPWASRYDAAADLWGEAAPLMAGPVWGHRAGVDTGGNAVAVYIVGLLYGSPGEVWANAYDAAAGDWTTAERISSAGAGAGASNGDGIALAVADNGVAVAVWQEGGQIWANRFR